MNTNFLDTLRTTPGITSASPVWLAVRSNATTATAEAGHRVSAPAPDNVGMLILGVLFAGVTIAVLIAMIDRLQSICEKLLQLVETTLRERTPASRSIIINDGVHPVVATPKEPASAPAATAIPPQAQPVKTRPDNSATKARTFRVELAKDLLPKIHSSITDFLTEHGWGNEAGGMFVGEYLLDEATQVATFKIRAFIEAGPNADFSAGSIQFDTEFQHNALRALQAEHPQAVNVGCWHRQLADMDACSGGDLVADREAIADSDTKALVFGIITLKNPRQLPSSLFYRDFKIDFYLMAEETGLRYEPILPTVADLPLLEASPAMTELHALRGPELTYDLAVLKQLPGLVKTTLSKFSSAAGVLLTAKFADLGQPFQIWIRPSGALCLFHQGEDGRKQELNGPWIQNEMGKDVWLSHLLLKARAVLTHRNMPGYQRHFGLLEDKFRLVAEVRAMNERYGERAVLRRRRDTLYWEYVVHESGRSFPIEIRYPGSYPADPPEIFSLKRLPPSPHQLSSENPCWLDVYSSHSEWNPARDTAAVCIAATHRWFACLLVYLTIGKWPEGADHP